MIRVRYFTFFAVVSAFSYVGRAAAVPPPETSLNTCQDKVRTEGKKAVKNTVTVKRGDKEETYAITFEK